MRRNGDSLRAFAAHEIAGREHADAGDLKISGDDAAGVSRRPSGEIGGEHARLLIGGLHQPVADAAMFGAFTERKHALEVSHEGVVDEDASIRPKAGFPREIDIWLDANGEDDRVHVQYGAVAKFDGLNGRLSVNARGAGVQQHAHALSFDETRQQGAAIRVELALHQPVHDMRERDMGAALDEAVGGLQSEQAAADHDDSLAIGAETRELLHVRDVAECVDPGEIDAREWEAKRARAGRDDELAVGDVLAVRQLYDFSGPYRSRCALQP